ncbi:hypothetical protein JB92DRAFT_2836592 [Gautieria morchelliformis]|nr:hypothetical protein JB92DRAFT_2836592 [Gautieria morchelliformis]
MQALPDVVFQGHHELDAAHAVHAADGPVAPCTKEWIGEVRRNLDSGVSSPADGADTREATWSGLYYILVAVSATVDSDREGPGIGQRMLSDCSIYKGNCFILLRASLATRRDVYMYILWNGWGIRRWSGKVKPDHGNIVRGLKSNPEVLVLAQFPKLHQYGCLWWAWQPD